MEVKCVALLLWMMIGPSIAFIEISVKTCPFKQPEKEVICGSDGKTYKSVCHFFLAQLENPNLFVHRRGPCSIDGSTPKTTKFPSWIHPDYPFEKPTNTKRKKPKKTTETYMESPDVQEGHDEDDDVVPTREPWEKPYAPPRNTEENVNKPTHKPQYEEEEEKYEPTRKPYENPYERPREPFENPYHRPHVPDVTGEHGGNHNDHPNVIDPEQYGEVESEDNGEIYHTRPPKPRRTRVRSTRHHIPHPTTQYLPHPTTHHLPHPTTHYLPHTTTHYQPHTTTTTMRQKKTKHKKCPKGNCLVNLFVNNNFMKG